MSTELAYDIEPEFQSAPVVPMTEREARACVEVIHKHLNRARAKIYELYTREGWLALGYASWRECVVKEFGSDQSYLYRQLSAAQVELQISPMGEIGAIPERHLRPLTTKEVASIEEIAPAFISTLWKVAEKTAPGGEVTASHVQSVVDVMTGIIHDGGLDDGSGEVTPLGVLIDATVTEETYERLQRQKEYIKASQKPHVAHNTGENEWYTPPDYIARARALMGDIDLDPASSDKAQEAVGAACHFTKDVDGLAHEWRGRVWMNPPYASGLVEKFTAKLADSYRDGDVTQALALVNNATDTAWFQYMAAWATSVLFIRGRVRFLDPEGKPGAPLQGQALVYFGANAADFAQAFGDLGLVLHL